jgi:hypothetical protein
MTGPSSRSLSDYAFDFFKSIVDGNGPTLLGGINTSPSTVQQTTDMAVFGGDVAAPGAGGVVASLGSIPAGTYDFYLYTNLSGTTAGLDRPNLAFNINGSQKMVALSTMGGITDPSSFRATVPANATATITAIVASTAGSVYRGTIVARRVA